MKFPKEKIKSENDLIMLSSKCKELMIDMLCCYLTGAASFYDEKDHIEKLIDSLNLYAAAETNLNKISSDSAKVINKAIGILTRIYNDLSCDSYKGKEQVKKNIKNKILNYLLEFSIKYQNEFIENEEFISFFHLYQIDLNECPPFLLQSIEKKIKLFIQQKITNDNSEIWRKIIEIAENAELTPITIFNNISKLKLILDLTMFIEYPYFIQQPRHTNLCGPTAILTYMFTELPEISIDLVIQFFYKGVVSEPFGLVASSDSKNNDFNIITALMKGMKHYSNSFLGYSNSRAIPGSILEFYSGMTEPRQMVNWLKSLGGIDIYEDISVRLPFTDNVLPEFLVNLLCGKKSFSEEHSCIHHSYDRLTNLNKLHNYTENKLILLLDVAFWENIKYKVKFNTKDDVIKSTSISASVGHYVYLNSCIKLNNEEKFNCIFYADGELIKATIDAKELAKGLKGIISWGNMKQQLSSKYIETNTKKIKLNTKPI